jgi:4a-hydroxytetrahydrobiopterin dehydratase
VSDAANLETADLLAMRCEACRPDSPLVTPEEAAALRPRIPKWREEVHDGVPRLVRTFRFKTYREGLDFTLRVGELAEAEDHHPLLLTAWGRVTVSWWTHAIRGLHRNDFIMAARTDALYEAGREAGGGRRM